MVDYVLNYFDNVMLDDVWARILPFEESSLDPSTYFGTNSTLDLGTLKSSSSYIDPLSTTQASAWSRDDWRRQFLSLYVLVLIAVHLMYFAIAGLSYYFIFDHRLMKHPRFLKNQIWLEIKKSLIAFPTIDLLTTPFFVAELQGYSKLYDKASDGPWGGGFGAVAYFFFSSAFFLWFTDLGIYFIHRWLHHPRVYKYIHKPHHKWIVPSPFAAFAFHPLDGFAQSVPYHIFVFIVPLHKVNYLGLFVLVQLWSIFIHDSELISNNPLEHFINGPSHHTLHHLQYTVNYGQYFTWADKLGGSFRLPAKGDDPLLTILDAQERKDLVAKEKQKAIDAYQAELSSSQSSDSSSDSQKLE